MSGYDERLEEVLAEYLRAVDAGAAPDADDFAAAHPEFGDDLREFMTARAQFGRIAALFTPSFELPATGGASTLVRMPSASGPRGAGSLLPEDSGREGASTAAAPPVRHFGEYELLRELGRGGMGVVYAARERRLDRTVALKMILSGQFASADEVRRFQVEARSAARLDHPNIVPIYEVGEHRGRHFFTMKLVGSGTLAEHREQFCGDNRAAVRLMAMVARAVHYAHQRGVLHRDLKPGNVLLDEAGRPQVTDFGLARHLEGDGGGMTVSGAVLGSPRYMAPEQARGGKALTVATDVWGLGAILYELLAGRPPFTGDSVLETLRRVRDQEPERLSSAAGRHIDRDLETVCLKCLEKDPARRYSSAEALASDLDRWLAGEPVAARAVRPPERVWRWCRRNRALSILTGLAIAASVATVAVLAVSVVLISQSNQANRGLAEQNGKIARVNDALARREEDLRVHVERQAAGLGFESALGKCYSEGPAEGMLWLARSLEDAVRVKDAALERSVRRQLAAWGGRLPRLESVGPTEHGNCVANGAFSGDGRTLLTDGKRGLTVPYATDTMTKLGPGRLGCNGGVALTTDGKVMAVAVDEDGRNKRNSPSAVFLDVASGQPVAPPIPGLPDDAIFVRLAFSPDGSRLLGADDRGFVRLWDVAAGRQIGPTFDANKEVDAEFTTTVLAFNPTGDLFLIGGYGNQRPDVGLWKPGESGWARVGEPMRTRAEGAVFGPDGRTLLTAGENVRLWELPSGKPTGRPIEHGDVVRAAAFSPDGSVVATGGGDRIVRLWDARSGREIAAPLVHSTAIVALSFSPDGTALSVLTVAEVRVWRLGDERIVTTLAPREALAAVSPDGSMLATIDANGSVFLRSTSVASGATLRTRIGGQGVPRVQRVYFGADARHILTVSQEGVAHRARVYEVSSGNQVGVPWDLPWPPRPDQLQQGLDWGATVVATVTADGGTAVISIDGNVGVWTVATGAAAGSPQRGCKAISSDGTRVAVYDRPDLAGGAKHDVQVLEVGTWRLVGTRMQHGGDVGSAMFDQAGRHLITGCDDGSARLWDAGTGLPVSPKLHHGIAMHDWPEHVAIGPDGATLLTVGAQTTRLWEAGTWQRIGPPAHEPIIAFIDEGRGLLTNPPGRLRSSPVPAPISGTPERVMLWAQVITALNFGADGTVHRMDDDRHYGLWWQDQHKRLTAMGQPLLP